MKRLFTNTLICTCLGAASAASAVTVPRTVEVINEGTTHRDLYGVAMYPDGARGVAVGDRGTLVVTEDGGASWSQRQLDTQLALFDTAVQEDRWVVVGQMGLIRYSDDAGESWSSADAGTEERLLGVSANATGLAVAVGSFGTILVSNDGGASWHAPDFDVSEVVEDAYQAHLNDVHVAGDGTVLIAGEFGLILRSADGGESWDVVNEGEVSLFGLHLRADGIGYAVGQEGTVLRTEDAGESWVAVDTGMDANLLGVVSSPDGTITVPGMRRMIVSDDGGATWAPLTAADVNRNWYGAVVQGGGGVYAVGHTTRVIRIAEEQ